MSTRSDIIVRLSNGQWGRIYCHWDGYPEHNGKILAKHYASQTKAEKLIALGDLSLLAPSTKKPRGHTFDNHKKGFCVAYGRDRGEADCEATIGDSLAEVWPDTDTWTEYTYVWDGQSWWLGDPDEGSQALISLADYFDGKKTIHPLIKTPIGPIGRH